MKSSIKFLAIIALVLTCTFAANAQRGGGKSIDPTEMAEKETAQMVEKLSLNEKQTAQISAINLDYAKEMHEAHEANKDDRDGLKEISTSIQTRKSAELKYVLTEAQFKTYEEMQLKGGKGREGEGGKGGRGGKGGGRGR